MIYKILICLLFFNSSLLAQKKVLLFSNLSSDFSISSALVEKAKPYGVELKPSTSLDSISDFQAVFFLDFDVKKLNMRDNAALMLFFKNGGGAIGSFDIQSRETNRIWFEQMFGMELALTKVKSDMDLIPLQDLGMGLPALWKVQMVTSSTPLIPKYLSPVLMTLGGVSVAWIGKSEFGNQVFYTSIKLDANALNNDAFMGAVFGGVKSVLSNQKSQAIENLILPLASDFRLVKLSNSLGDASCLEYFSEEYCFVLTKSGELFNYHFISKEFYSLGRFDYLAGATDLKLDPEFDANGFIYFYFGSGNSKVKRLKIISPNKAELDDLEVESSLPIKNTFLSQSDSTNVGMPVYYQAKRFVLKEGVGLQVYTLDNTGETLDIESFVLDLPQDSIRAIAQRKNGEMLVLFDGSLNVLQYKNQGNFRPNVDFTYKILSKKLPYKIEFSALVENGNEAEWEILGKKIKGNNINQVFKTPGEFMILLKTYNTDGLSDSVIKTIKIEKAPIK